MSRFSGKGSCPTTNGRRYIQQLCKHWAHNLSVEFNEQQGKIIFPKNARGAEWPGDGVVMLIAHPDRIECQIEATAEGQVEGLKGAVVRHLDRFAFREAPLKFSWNDPE